MALRDNPYGAFNFMVELGDAGGEDQIVGGFSDVSGLGNEVKYSEYRNGNDKENHVRKVANTNTTDDVTLKRGVIGDLRLFAWLKATREGDVRPADGHDHAARRGARSRCASWVLQRGPAEEVGRADAGRQGRRRGRDGGAAPGRRADRLRVAVTVAGLQLGAPGVYRAPAPAEPPLRRRSGWTSPGSSGVAPRGPVDDPVPVDELVGLRVASSAASSAQPGARRLLPHAVHAFFAQGGARGLGGAGRRRPPAAGRCRPTARRGTGSRSADRPAPRWSSRPPDEGTLGHRARESRCEFDVGAVRSAAAVGGGRLAAAAGRRRRRPARCCGCGRRAACRRPGCRWVVRLARPTPGAGDAGSRCWTRRCDAGPAAAGRGSGGPVDVDVVTGTRHGRRPRSATVRRAGAASPGSGLRPATRGTGRRAGRRDVRGWSTPPAAGPTARCRRDACLTPAPSPLDRARAWTAATASTGELLRRRSTPSCCPSADADPLDERTRTAASTRMCAGSPRSACSCVPDLIWRPTAPSRPPSTRPAGAGRAREFDPCAGEPTRVPYAAGAAAARLLDGRDPAELAEIVRPAASGWSQLAERQRRFVALLDVPLRPAAARDRPVAGRRSTAATPRPTTRGSARCRRPATARRPLAASVPPSAVRRRASSPRGAPAGPPVGAGERARRRRGASRADVGDRRRRTTGCT